MENPIYIGLSRQTALRREMTTVANNIANMNTTGFKREMNVYNTYDSNPRQTNKIAFVIDQGTAIDFQPGPVKPTMNSLDFALSGPGFFVIDDGSGFKYSRNGAFSLDESNQLVNHQGHPVMDEGGAPIVLDGKGKVEVTGDGSITVDGALAGRMRLVEFPAYHKMRKVGEGTYDTDQDPQPPFKTRVMQRALEESNVNSVLELTRMIDIHRTYDGVKTLIEKEGERQRSAVQRLGRTTQA